MRLVSASTAQLPPRGSTVFVTPLSSPRICWVRSATITACSDGRARVSSSEFVCSDCTPPRIPASACTVTRTMLLSGCCAVRETPAVCAWVRRRSERSSRAPKRSRMIVAHRRRAARSFATSSRKSLWRVKKKESRGAKLSTGRPRARPASPYGVPAAVVKAGSWTGGDPARRVDVRDAVGDREGELLDGGGSGLADVVAADRHRVPARHLAAAELHHVDHDAERRLGRADPLLLRDELLQHVVLDRAAERGPGD